MATPPRPWTVDDNAHLHRHYRTTTLASLAADLNRSEAEVETRARQLGLHHHQPRAWTRREDAYLRKHYHPAGPMTRLWQDIQHYGDTSYIDDDRTLRIPQAPRQPPWTCPTDDGVIAGDLPTVNVSHSVEPPP